MKSVDRWIAELAGRQHGVVGRRQLLDGGIGRRAIDHRLAHGRLHQVHRGVYTVGHRVMTAEARWIAAVTAAGSGAALSHRAAGTLQGLGHWWHLEVTVPRSRRRRQGILVHYLHLPEDEITIERGIAVTTVPRTLFDLAAVLPLHQVERVINDAEIRGLRDHLSLARLLERYPSRHGAPAVRAVLGRLEEGVAFTRSDLEAAFRDLARSAGLPMPRFNHLVLGFECDCAWPEHRLVVELDGRSTHGTAAAFERDRERDRALVAAGWRVVRITWRQLRHDRERVIADLTRLLASGT